MDATATAWMIGLLGFAAGIAFGAIIYHFTRGDSGSKSKLEHEIDDLQVEYEQYKENVGTHFARTAELVNQLTESYRDVHAHLASGAQTLCGDNDSLRRQLESSLANRLIETEEEAPVADAVATEAHPVEPPRDYAPKAGPDDSGTLSEEFSLRKGETAKES